MFATKMFCMFKIANLPEHWNAEPVGIVHNVWLGSLLAVTCTAGASKHDLFIKRIIFFRQESF